MTDPDLRWQLERGWVSHAAFWQTSFPFHIHTLGSLANLSQPLWHVHLLRLDRQLNLRTVGCGHPPTCLDTVGVPLLDTHQSWQPPMLRHPPPHQSVSTGGVRPAADRPTFPLTVRHTQRARPSRMHLPILPSAPLCTWLSTVPAATWREGPRFNTLWDTLPHTHSQLGKSAATVYTSLVTVLEGSCGPDKCFVCCVTDVCLYLLATC